MIKANPQAIVKTPPEQRQVARLAWIVPILLVLFSPLHSKAQQAADPELPAIEAKPFATSVIKRSQSQRVYLMEAKDYMPRVGKIVLLKRESQNTMALRVIKTYDDKKQYAGRKVREYGGRKVLPLGDAYLGLEKLRDLGPYQPSDEDIKLDEADLRELEGPESTPVEGLPSVNPFDDELDAGTSPPPVGAVDDRNSEPFEEQDDNLDNLIADDVQPLDPDNQWLSAQFGYFRNSDSQGSTRLNTGGGFRYGITLGRLVFLSSVKAQDSIVIEGGAFIYKILEFETSTDAFTVMPLIGSIRYNILFSEDFSIFFYTGLYTNLVISVSQGSQNAVNLLSSTLPAGGAGALFRIGPKWHLRMDAGLDMIGAGLVLRF